MIDYIKLDITYLGENRLLSNPNLNWVGQHFIDSGMDLNYPKICTYYNLKIKINKKTIILSGSLHKFYNIYFNNLDQNYNDFTIQKLKIVLKILVDKIQIQPSLTRIQNLEYGVNLNLDLKPEFFLENNLVVWNGECPSISKKPENRGKYLQFERTQYYIKIYDKGQQYFLNENVLRIEKKVLKNQYLAKKGISKLADLVNSDCLSNLGKDILEETSKFIIVDNLFDKPPMTVKEEQIWSKGTNPKFWDILKNNHRSKKSRFKKSFENLIIKYRLDTLKNGIIHKVEAKINRLINCDDFTDLDYEKSATILHVGIEEKCQERKLCPVTGIDISHQPKQSRFLSQSTVYDLFLKKDVLFDSLLEKFLIKEENKYDSPKEISYYIAHNIRNTYWNKKYFTESKRKKYENSLFPISIAESNVV